MENGRAYDDEGHGPDGEADGQMENVRGAPSHKFELHESAHDDAIGAVGGDGRHGDEVGVGDEVPEGSGEGAEVSCSREVAVDEDGKKDRKAGGAVEEVTETEVEDEDGGGTSQPGEAVRIPQGNIRDSQEGEEVAQGAHHHDCRGVNDEEDLVVGNLLWLAPGVVATARGRAFNCHHTRVCFERLWCHFCCYYLRRLCIIGCAHCIFVEALEGR